MTGWCSACKKDSKKQLACLQRKCTQTESGTRSKYNAKSRVAAGRRSPMKSTISNAERKPRQVKETPITAVDCHLH